MELKYAEKRRDIRYPFLKTIDYVCNIPADAATYKAVTINLSQSGMCLYMFLSPCINEGHEISIQDTLPVSRQKGTIRWVDKIEDDLFKVGLMFV